jgi:hypothetical protein
MQSIIQNCAVLCLVAASALAAPQAPRGSDAAATIEKDDREVNFDGSYRYSYQTSNGIAADEQGALKNVGTDAEGIAAAGQFSYVSPEGVPIRVVYSADDNGFQPQGDHLPTPPPIPPAIQRALEYLATLPSTPDTPVAPGNRRF